MWIAKAPVPAPKTVEQAREVSTDEALLVRKVSAEQLFRWPGFAALIKGTYANRQLMNGRPQPLSYHQLI
jgi:hypothetical protein